MPSDIESLLEARNILEAFDPKCNFRWVYTETGMHHVTLPGTYRAIRRYVKARRENR